VFVIGFMCSDVLFSVIQGRRNAYDTIYLCTLNMLLIKWGGICCLRVETVKGDGKRIKRQRNWAPVVNMLLQTLLNVIHLLVVTTICV
jgi:hypothetical protein